MSTIYAVMFCYLLSGAWSCTIIDRDPIGPYGPGGRLVAASPTLESCKGEADSRNQQYQRAGIARGIEGGWVVNGLTVRYACVSKSVPAWQAVH